MDTSTWMAFRVIANTVYENIMNPEAEKTKKFTALDYPLPYLGAEAVLNDRRAVSFYFDEGDLKKGSIFRPLHKMDFKIDLFAAADAKGDLKILEKQFEGDFDQLAKRSAMNLIFSAERRVNFLLDELIDIVYQLIMKKENHQLGVDRLEPAAGFTIGSRMISEIIKGNIVKDDQTAELVTMRAEMTLNCQATEKVTGQAPLAVIPPGDVAEIFTTLEINNDEITKAGVKTGATE